jgi:ATP-dependent helicase/nuclease subunit A
MTTLPDTEIGRTAGRAQRRATDGGASVWVSASAGTGKTKVLADRVLGLLLGGVKPERILCLTFTRAAAAEMANRVTGTLAQWVAAEDADLATGLAPLIGHAPDPDEMRQARRIFARVLDTAGGLRIETIHGFCQSLLARFPLEAGVPPHFRGIDENTAGELLAETVEGVLLSAREETEPKLSHALAQVTAEAAETEFRELLGKLVKERGRLQRLLDRHGGIDGLAGTVRRTLDIADNATVAELIAAACRDGAFDGGGLRRATVALAKGEKTDRERGAILSDWLARPDRRAEWFDNYRLVYFTDERDRRKHLATKAAKAADNGAEAVLAAEAERLKLLADACHRVRIADATSGLLALGAAVLDAYRQLKERRAELDYDDLVLKARDLLTTEGVAAWVLFKLDGGIDHILIDEAQDTNPEQWEVVKALAAEFFAGAGAREVERTVFAVGDPKQSIFSFQRADPAEFQRMQQHFAERAAAAGCRFEAVPLTVSFRSVPVVLQAVDAVFQQVAADEGEAALSYRQHLPIREGAAGLVELWPLAVSEAAASEEPWEPPVGRRQETPSRLRLARLLARRIRRMIAGGEILEARGRRIKPGDIMVLVRRRDAFVEELIRQLKSEGVPVAGLDRMRLTDQLAVMDLMALGRFLVLPEDDLTLATLLKSPLVGLDEDRLFRLAYDRRGRLWAELARRRDEDPEFARAHERLSGLLARADLVRPYELFAEVLGPLGGRRLILGRLGPDAADPVEEFLTQALIYERAHPPSLEGFLHWIERGGLEVKRDLDRPRGEGEVRVMTVHGAKGLQAPIVFLPDTTRLPAQTQRLMWMEEGQGPCLWVPVVGYDVAITTACRDTVAKAEEREERRLLYVAMTRAEDRLYVCGWLGQKPLDQGSWYRLVERGLDGVAAKAAFDFTAELGRSEGWVGAGLRLAGRQEAAISAEATATGPLDIPPLPSWASRTAPAEPVPSRPLAPSRPEEEPTVRSPVGADAGAGFRRGRLIHRLLQTVPDLPPARRPEACRRFLAVAAADLDSTEREAIAAEVLRLFDDAAFAGLWGPDSLAEVPVVGEIGGRVLSGRIDRLLVERARVLVVDYKTNRPAPVDAAQVPPVYLRQMAAYRAALRRIYPGREVSCALLWTDLPRLMSLDALALDQALVLTPLPGAALTPLPGPP